MLRSGNVPEPYQIWWSRIGSLVTVSMPSAGCAYAQEVRPCREQMRMFAWEPVLQCGNGSAQQAFGIAVICSATQQSAAAVPSWKAQCLGIPSVTWSEGCPRCQGSSYDCDAVARDLDSRTTFTTLSQPLVSRNSQLGMLRFGSTRSGQLRARVRRNFALRGSNQFVAAAYRIGGPVLEDRTPAALGRRG